MRLASVDRLKLARIAESALIGTLGGFLLDAAKFPAGWLAGSMLFAAAAALSGRTIALPAPLARTCSIVLGITIGGVVTPETLRGVATWPLSIFAVTIAMAASTLATVTYLTRLHGWSTMTAIFAGTPGGLAQVMALATQDGRDCDVRGIAIVQTLRVVILAVCVPAVLSLAGLAGPARLPASATAIADEPIQFAILVGVSRVAALGLLRLGFPGGLIFGPLVVSAVLHGGAFISVTMPSGLATAAMVGIGTVSGGRFSGTPFRLLLGYLGAGLGSFAVSLIVAGAIGAGVTVLVSLPLPDVIVAYAPGAVDAMMILALALHLDPIFVGAHHLTRVFVVSLGLPILAYYFSPPESKRMRRDPVLPKGTGLDD
jgi:membrane AbrB-like protein